MSEEKKRTGEFNADRFGVGAGTRARSPPKKKRTEKKRSRISLLFFFVGWLVDWLDVPIKKKQHSTIHTRDLNLNIFAFHFFSFFCALCPRSFL